MTRFVDVFVIVQFRLNIRLLVDLVLRRFISASANTMVNCSSKFAQFVQFKTNSDVDILVSSLLEFF